jgi:hypothetical protein
MAVLLKVLLKHYWVKFICTRKNGRLPQQLLQDVNTNYGYKLHANFGNIFSPKNKFNSESIFELVHSGNQSYTWNNWDQFKSNIYVQMVGPRSYTGPVYYGGGYGFNPITTQLVTAMKGDPRYGYTIVNIDSLAKAKGSIQQVTKTQAILSKNMPCIS